MVSPRCWAECRRVLGGKFAWEDGIVEAAVADSLNHGPEDRV